MFNSFIHLLPILHGSCLEGTGKGKNWWPDISPTRFGSIPSANILSRFAYKKKRALHMYIYLYTYIETREQTRFSRRETLSLRVSRIESRVSSLEDQDASDCQLTFERYCNSFFQPWHEKVRYTCVYLVLSAVNQAKRLGHRSNTMVKRLALFAIRTLAKQLVEETTVNWKIHHVRIRKAWDEEERVLSLHSHKNKCKMTLLHCLV